MTSEQFREPVEWPDPADDPDQEPAEDWAEAESEGGETE